MSCSYCGSQNSPDDHRCGRCGRRLNDEPVRRPVPFPVQRSAAAPQIELETEADEAPAPRVATEPALVPNRPKVEPVSRESVQAPLFGPQDVARTMTARPEPMTPAPSARRRAARTEKQALDFDTTTEIRTLPTSVEAAVYCNATVAPAADRAFAAVVDALIPLGGFAFFLGVSGFYSGSLVIDARTLPYYAASLFLLTAFYRVLCCIGGMDSLGVQWAGLRLLKFDGRRPGPRARFFRLIGSVISLVALGIGFLWSLLDEERLAWHDHMSGTFPARRQE